MRERIASNPEARAGSPDLTLLHLEQSQQGLEIVLYPMVNFPEQRLLLDQ